ncbi:MAG: hypothetical protein WBQ34_11540 [Candidatus Acidiferrales bacterium]
MIRRAIFVVIAIFISAIAIPSAALARRAAAPFPSSIAIGGDVPMLLTLSLTDLEKMPQTTLQVVNPPNHKMELYRGVPPDMLLQKAGVSHGEAIRGKWMATYVLATAADAKLT